MEQYKQMEEWKRTAAIQATIANAAPSDRRRRAYTMEDFLPKQQARRKPDAMGTIQDLKRLIDGRGYNQNQGRSGVYRTDLRPRKVHEGGGPHPVSDA